MARGFQNKVDEINREMIKRLEAIQRKEREEQERIEAEKERKRLEKEAELQRKLKGNPFNLITDKRAMMRRPR